ncbi:hypothetical protein GGR54DRAFT_96878 [Hypoxylon sp. NC1633]|nr:hypothetical protein GGR54DRAFT_96878 [Hypoxylon sp. NC1633]
MPQDGSITASKSYTPDYTVFKGNVGHDPGLLADHEATLAVGDVKLYGGPTTKNPVDHTNALSQSDLGQMLWYCVCRKTRFAFCVSDAELVLMEFVVRRSEDMTALSNAVARAGSELSSPMQEFPIRGEPATGNRRNTTSTTGSTVSPSDRHQQKRSAAAAEAVESDASSPDLSSSILEQSSPPCPRTPDLKSKHPHSSSDGYVPSTPGEISAQTLQNLVSTGGKVVVHLFTIPIRRREQWAPALFSFIALAKLVDESGGKNISAGQVNLQNYSI